MRTQRAPVDSSLCGCLRRRAARGAGTAGRGGRGTSRRGTARRGRRGRPRGGRPQAVDAGLLGGLAAGRRQEVPVAVDVATGLEPPAQLAVVEQQGAPRRRSTTTAEAVRWSGSDARSSGSAARRRGRGPGPGPRRATREAPRPRLGGGRGRDRRDGCGTVVVGERASPSGIGAFLRGRAETWGWPGRYQRHGRSAPADRPMRVLVAGATGSGGAVVDEGDAPVGADEVGAVEGPVDPEGLAEPGRARGEVAVAPAPRGGRRAWRRRPATGAGGSQQHRPGPARRRRTRRWRTSASRR